MTTTLAQTGENLQVVGWVDDAWNKIQQSRNWDWMWENPTVTIIAATNTTATNQAIAAARYEHTRTLDVNGSPLIYMPWARFTRAYPLPQLQSGTPMTWTIRPDKAFVVNAKPAANYAVTVERYKNPTAMTTDTDAVTGTPAMPAEHHMLIVWRACMLYAGYDDATGLYQHSNAEYKKMLAALGITDKPAPKFEYTW